MTNARLTWFCACTAVALLALAYSGIGGEIGKAVWLILATGYICLPAFVAFNDFINWS